MGEFNEYVFCPHCGGITAPGTCVNCGMPTNGQLQSQNIVQSEIAEQTVPAQESAYYKYQPKEQGQPAMYGYEQYQPQPQPRVLSQTEGGVQGQSPAQFVPYEYRPNQQPNVAYTEKPKKKSRWWIWLLVIGFILFFGMFLVALAIVFAIVFLGAGGDITTTNINGQPQVVVEPLVTAPNTTEPYVDSDIIVQGRELGRLDFSNFDWDYYADSAMVYSDTDDGSTDLFLNKDYESSFGTNHDNHTLSEFSGEYYEAFGDCIDTSYDYGLSRHFISYSDVVDNMIVSADIAYIQLKGNTVPNEDILNQQILEMTANDFWGYLDGQKPLSYTPEEVEFVIDSFIPYNDGEKMSILLDVNVYYDGYQQEHHIYAINIDLENGTIMDNASILEIDEAFGAMFRERNNAQNGADVLGVVNCTDEELADLLASSDTNIIFFSPYGMEVGFNYMSDGYSWAWVTITLSDYQDYLN